MDAAQPLAGLSICLHGSIPLLQRRLKFIQPRLEQLGAHVCLDLPQTLINTATAGAAAAVATSPTPASRVPTAAAAAGAGLAGGPGQGAAHPEYPHGLGAQKHSVTSPNAPQKQQQQQLGPLARHAKRKRASLQVTPGSHALGITTAVPTSGTADGGAAAKRSKTAAAAAAEGTSTAPPASGQCDSLTHIVLQVPAHGASTWHASTGGGSSSSGGAGSSSDGGSSGSRGRVKGSTPADAVSINGNVQLLLNQLQVYQQQLDTAGSLPSPTQQARLQRSTDTPGDAQQQSVHPTQQQQQQQQLHLVSAAWLESVLSTGRHVAEAPYSLNHLLQQQQRQRGGRLTTAAAAPAGPMEGDVSQRHDGAAGSGVGVLRRLPDLSNLPDAPLGRLAPWLGHWSPELDNITSQVELVLHARYIHVDAAPRGSNAFVRAALKELESIETAVGGGAVRRVQRANTDPPPINHEALTYAHAAATVRACAFPLNANMSPALLQQLLPFCGAFSARIIHQLLASGTCDPLERYRANQPVLNSRGEVRPNTAGGKARELFARLPGVGQKQALAWFEAGCTSIADVIQLVQPAVAATTSSSAAGAPTATGGVDVMLGLDGDGAQGVVLGTPAESGGALSSAGVAAEAGRPAVDPAAAAAGVEMPAVQVGVSNEAVYSLQYSSDLLEAVPEDDVREMRNVVLEALAAVSGRPEQEWRMQLVGGGRRSKSVHDADFLVSHPTFELEGLVLQLYRWLVSHDRLVPREQGFLRLQQGRMVGYKARARGDILAKKWTDKQQMDAYDHIWGIFITAAGRRRRCDVMLIPPAMWPFALLGWSGSKQYLRFMRQHAGNCGMNMNSHGLFRMVEVRARPLHAALASPVAAAAAAAAGPKAVTGGTAAGATAHRTSSSSPAGGDDTDGQSDAAAAAAPSTVGGSSIEPSSSSSSSSVLTLLAEAVGYVQTSAAAGMSKVVLSVPDEAPPLDRDLQEKWPPGWSAAAAVTAAAGGGGAAAAAAAAGVAAAGGGVAAGGGGFCGAQEGAGAMADSVAQKSHSMAQKSHSVAQESQQRATLAALVCAGCGSGSGRAVVSEQDICQLLGVPYREPSERCA